MIAHTSIPGHSLPLRSSLTKTRRMPKSTRVSIVLVDINAHMNTNTNQDRCKSVTDGLHHRLAIHGVLGDIAFLLHRPNKHFKTRLVKYGK